MVRTQQNFFSDFFGWFATKKNFFRKSNFFGFFFFGRVQLWDWRFLRFLVINAIKTQKMCKMPKTECTGPKSTQIVIQTPKPLFSDFFRTKTNKKKIFQKKKFFWIFFFWGGSNFGGNANWSTKCYNVYTKSEIAKKRPRQNAQVPKMTK